MALLAAEAGHDYVLNLSALKHVRSEKDPFTLMRLIEVNVLNTTATIARTIAQLPAADRPAVLLQASGVGWYGDTGDAAVTEEAPAGTDFLADVCRAWEAATRPAEDGEMIDHDATTPVRAPACARARLTPLAMIPM